MIDDSTCYIARISHGKDSLKMLEVIKSRGLPLDRITTTDVWATDTISARLPPMEEFVARMDQRIWDMYHIQVEHLCARNKDGSKRTYEQMFYHIPNRKTAGGGYCQGTILGFPDLWNKWCQAGLKRNAHAPSSRDDYRLPSQHPVQLVPEAQNLRGSTRDSLCQQELPGASSSRSEQRNQGFPAQISTWCRKLEIDYVKTPFLKSAGSQRAKTEILWSTSESPPTSLPGLDSSMPGSVRRWWSSELTRIYAACTASITICWHQPMKPHAGMAAGSAIIKAWISSDFYVGTTPIGGRC